MRETRGVCSTSGPFFQHFPRCNRVTVLLGSPKTSPIISTTQHTNNPDKNTSGVTVEGWGWKKCCPFQRRPSLSARPSPSCWKLEFCRGGAAAAGTKYLLPLDRPPPDKTTNAAEPRAAPAASPSTNEVHCRDWDVRE